MLTEAEWNKRKEYIGASEAAAVVGVSRWSTPLQVWAIKTGQIPYSDEETLQQWVGTNLEEIVAKRFTKETGQKVRRVNEPFRHKKYPFLTCQIDRKIVGEDTILECKTASAYKVKEWDEEEIPIEYILQVYHQLACTGYKKAFIACLIGNHKFVIKEILYDESVIKDLVKKEVYFWKEFVEKKIMPGMISAKDGDVLYQLFPVAIEGDPLPLDDEANIIIENLDALKSDKKSLEYQIEKKKNQLKAMLGDSEVGETSIYQVTWKNSIRKAYEVEEKELRTLRYKAKKEEG